MKNHWIRIAAISVAMLGLSACSSESDSTRIHVETPFSVATAGNKATLEFQATDQQVKAGKDYMVSLTFSRIEGADPTNAVGSVPPRTLLPFKVKVARLSNDGTSAPIELTGGSYYLGKLDPAQYPDYMPEDAAADIYYAFNYALGYSPTKAPEGYLRLVSFQLEQPGRYRVEVETVQDKPVFAGVSSVLIVQKHFNLGK